MFIYLLYFYRDVHAVCLWDDKGPAKIHQALKEDILEFIKQAQARVLSHQDDTALLKAYIVEWRKFFTQCDILPKPFCQLEITLMGKQGSNKKSNVEDSIVRKVSRFSHFFPNILRRRAILRLLKVI